MPRFSANITFLYRELPLTQRFAAAKNDGFAAVEILSPEGVSASDLAVAAEAADIAVAMCNAPMGDFVEGGSGLSAVPGREVDFRAAIEEARELALALGCTKVHIGPSRVPSNTNKSTCLDCLASNLSIAATLLGEHGIEAMIEPLNNIDMPDICLSRVDEAIGILDDIGYANAALQFDVYHVAQMEADYVPLLTQHIGRIGHIQFADRPGRGEPGSGDFDFEKFFSLIDELGYTGWLGAEYQPTSTTGDTLDWLHKHD